MGRLDTSRHLNLLLNPEAFTAADIGENAKILLKYVRLTERLHNEAEIQARKKQVKDVNGGRRRAMSNLGQYSLMSNSIANSNEHTVSDF